MENELKIDQQAIKDAAMASAGYGCCTVRWKIGEQHGSEVHIVVTNDPDEKKRA